LFRQGDHTGIAKSVSKKVSEVAWLFKITNDYIDIFAKFFEKISREVDGRNIRNSNSTSDFFDPIVVL